MTTDSPESHAGLVGKRYDRFQQQAVEQIVEDFRGKPEGRFLLVIPTGGGKTFTAVKAINRLFELGVLSPTADKVLWVAHRDYLLEQAEETFARYREANPGQATYEDRVLFSTVQTAANVYSEPSVRLVVIDEAHHAAAPTYQPLFARPDVGVLGLTATPARHDGAPLEFERESFSIGFPDLVEYGVVLKPTILSWQGTHLEVKGLRSEADFDAFNDDLRNRKIVEGILQNTDKFRKVVVYVGTVRHVHALYRTLRESALNELYSISYICQDGNSLGAARKDFLAAERGKSRAIVVNVNILAEGYDDPSVDTVVMAVPTQSKLVYMQCMGRAIRHNPDDAEKRAYVVEVVDELPNIRYRIDNRWMYSEIADDLEPAVADRWYESGDGLRRELERLYDQYGVQPDLRSYPAFKERARYGMLLFKYYASGGFRHIPVLLDDNNRLAIANFYNYFSSRAIGFASNGYTVPALMRHALRVSLPGVSPDALEHVLEAMLNAGAVVSGVGAEPFMAHHPWITYVAFRFRRADIPAELLEVIETVDNKEEMVEVIRERRYPEGAMLFRAALPLRGYWGRILDEDEADAVQRYTDGLMDIRDRESGFMQCDALAKYVGASVFPLEQAYLQSAVAIVREAKPYIFQLP